MRNESLEDLAIQENYRWMGSWRKQLETFIQNQIDTLGMLNSMQASISELDSYEAKLKRYVLPKDLARTFDQPEKHLDAVITYLATHHDAWLNARAKIDSADKGESEKEENFRELNEYIRSLQAFIKSLTGEKKISFLQVVSIERLNYKVPGRDFSRKLTESTLTLMVAETELFMARLVSRFIDARPGILAADELKLGWKEIQKYSTVEELQEVLVSRKTDEVAGKSFDDFNEWFLKQIGDPGLPSEVLHIVSDAIQLRHLIIHNGSLMTSRGLSQFRDARYTDDLLGKQISLSIYDLETIARAQIAYCFALWLLVLSKLTKAEKAKSELIFGSASHIQVKLLENNLSEPILWSSNQVEKFVCSDGDSDVLFVNKCLARKMISDFTFKDEVESWDCSKKGEVMQLIKLVLLEKYKEAEIVAESLIDRGELPKNNLYEWPVFAPLRR